MRKPRSDRKLNALTPEQADQLWALMGTPGMPYARIQNLVREKFGLAVSIRALSEWWETRAKEEQNARFLRAANVANDIGSQAEKLPQLTRALKSTLTQWAFDMALSGTDAEKIKSVMGIVGGMERAALDQAKLRLDVEKFQIEVCEHFLAWFTDEKARAIADSTAPKAEKVALLRKAYFADVDELQAAGGVALPS